MSTTDPRDRDRRRPRRPARADHPRVRRPAREGLPRPHRPRARRASGSGPAATRCSIDHWDCRTGGSYRYVHASDGNEFGFHGCFHEVRPSSCIVQTFTFEGFPDEVALETPRARGPRRRPHPPRRARRSSTASRPATPSSRAAWRAASARATSASTSCSPADLADPGRLMPTRVPARGGRYASAESPMRRILPESAPPDVTRIVWGAPIRGFADGFVSVLLAQYLTGLGFSPGRGRRDRHRHAARLGRAHAGVRASPPTASSLRTLLLVGHAP